MDVFKISVPNGIEVGTFDNTNCLFCLYLYTFHFLRLKQKMDSLVFLIKKHNNNKKVGYNDKLAYITFINKNE